MEGATIAQGGLRRDCPWGLRGEAQQQLPRRACPLPLSYKYNWQFGTKLHEAHSKMGTVEKCFLQPTDPANETPQRVPR
jgi:hypothetical protein